MNKEQNEQNVNFRYVNYNTDRWNMEHEDEHAFETDDGICSFIVPWLIHTGTALYNRPVWRLGLCDWKP